MKQESTIDEVYRFYRSNIESHSAILQQLKRRIYHIGTLRLVLIAGMIMAVWLLRDKDWISIFIVGSVCLFCFIFLVVYHTKLYKKRAFEEGLIRLYENELKALDYDFSVFDGAPEQIESQHVFSMDLDIFGDRSLFQLTNRTVSQMGKEMLINWFKQPLNDHKEIVLRQEGVQEIKELTHFRHHFYVTGAFASKEKEDVRHSFSIHTRDKISGNRLIGLLIWFVPALWIIIIAGSILQWIPASILGSYFVISFLLANIPQKRINRMISSVTKTEKILKTYSKLLKQVEREHFNAIQLQKYQSMITGKSVYESTETTSASYAIKRLSRIIGALDQRFSLGGILFNLLYMRDTRNAMQLERWTQKYSDPLKTWFDTLGVFDAFCSVGTFAYNHPEYTYPTLAETYFEMKGKGLGHPLIHRDKCVRNDISIPKNNYFMIVTGANMAGKSTYLRTIGVNYLLACMGLPVCAESLVVYPAQLVTSLRTADSLTSNESYFFAELKRLKMIIDRLNAGEPLFILLDEILKGTNSVDKQKGSFALVKQLINKNTSGIIATHDLLLGTLSDTFPEYVQNKRFEADIRGDALTFTYRMQDGIAQNMNATFLMKKMGIIETG